MDRLVAVPAVRQAAQGTGAGVQWVKCWRLGWLKYGRWRPGVIYLGARGGPDQPWIAQIEFAEPQATGGTARHNFVYDERFIRPLDLPPDPPET